MVKLNGIDSKFLHCFLYKSRLRPIDLDLSTRGCIRNPDVIDRIRRAHRAFGVSGKTLENFFDSQIVEFKSYRINRPYTTDCEAIARSPIVLCFMDKGRGLEYKYGTRTTDLKIVKPIQVSLSYLFAMYGISDTPESLDPNHLASFEEKYGLNIHLHELRDDGRGHKSGSLPPPNDIGHTNIYIGLKDGLFYWLGKQLCSKNYFCTKLPGKCSYQTSHYSNYQAHIAACTDKTIVKADQVKYGYLNYL